MQSLSKDKCSLHLYVLDCILHCRIAFFFKKHRQFIKYLSNRFRSCEKINISKPNVAAAVDVMATT